MTDLSLFIESLKPLQNEVLSFKEKAEAIVITNDQEYSEAGDIAGLAKEKGKSIETMRKFFTVPINKQLDDINGLFMPRSKEADEIVQILKRKMTDYFNAKEEVRKKEEKRLQDIRDKANAKREEQGKEVIAEPVREVAEVTRTVSTGNTQSTVKKVWTHDIVDVHDIPEDIKKAILLEAVTKGLASTIIQKFVNAGIREMSGVKIYEKSQISLR